MPRIPYERDMLIGHEPHEVELDGIMLKVDSGVFTPDPGVTNSTKIILDHFPDVKGKKVLDVGTGTGVLAIRSALSGAEVLATDNSEIALKNAKLNAKSNGVERNIEFKKADLMDGLDGKFDFIFANLPILDRIWENKKDGYNALYMRLLESADNYLAPSGKIFLVWASFSGDNRQDVEKIFKQKGFKYEYFSEDRFGYGWVLYIARKVS